MDVQQEYRQKCKTPEELAQTVESGWLCVTGSGLSQPVALTRAIGARARANQLEGVIHSQVLTCYPSDFLDERLADRYSGVSWYTSSAARAAVQAGTCDIMPAYYRDIPKLWRDYLEPDLFYCTVSPMDRHGWFSFGATASEVEALMDKAARIYLEVNPNMPRTFGSQHIHISQVDALCENTEPLAEVPPIPPDSISETIGQLIAEQVKSGSTIQLGIGAIPDAVGRALAEKHDLGIHTELFTESMIDLIECGAVTNRKKPIHKGKTIAAFTQGTRRMYDFINDNPGIEFHSVDYVNDPAVIGRHPDFVSVNSCLEVDFYGQVCAESMGVIPYSGTGGQVDFVRGTFLSPGGQSFIACPSTAKGGTVSRIASSLAPGAVVTTGKNDVDFIVTEYGIASLKAKTLSQRTKNLIAIAHPKFRERLTVEAKLRNILI